MDNAPSQIVRETMTTSKELFKASNLEAVGGQLLILIFRGIHKSEVSVNNPNSTGELKNEIGSS